MISFRPEQEFGRGHRTEACFMPLIVRMVPILPGTIFLLATFPGTAPAQEQLSSGAFQGRSGHQTSGGVAIVKTDKGVEVRLGSNFSLDGAPGPWLGFGSSGRYDKGTQFTKLDKNKGAQTCLVPAGIDVSKYNEFYVWCKPFNVPLGVAELK